MAEVVAIIPARGGSKGIPRKNLLEVCGRPLLVWSILQARESDEIDSVWVSSDSPEILSVAEEYGAVGIERSAELSGDEASSESAWLHGLTHLESRGLDVEFVVGMQATSPVRESVDLDGAVEMVRSENLDSLLSVVEVQDFFVWRIGSSGPESVNYNYRSRQRRQVIENQYLENGSFYVFSPETLRKHSNRLGGRIGLYVMDRHKMFQIDAEDDVALVEAIMHGYGLDAA